MTYINNDLKLKSDITISAKKQQLNYASDGWNTIPGYLMLKLFNKKGDEFLIPFTLHNTRVANIWLKMFLALDPSDIKRKTLHWKWTKDKEKEIEENLLNSINKTVDDLCNKGFDFNYIKECDEEHTNDLHHEFEKWGDFEKERKKNNKLGINQPEIQQDKELANYMYTLNENIHAIEYYTRSKNKRKDPGMKYLKTKYENFKDWEDLKIYPGIKLGVSWNPTVHIDLIDEDWNEAMCLPGIDFGELCIGYSTLGKDVWSGIWDEDHELFERKMVITQKRFSNEISVKFDNIQHTSTLFEYRKLWKKVNPIDYNYGRFIENREGRISIGRVSDTFLYNYCNGIGLNIDLSKYNDYEYFFHESLFT